jgi:transposase-like protein
MDRYSQSYRCDSCQATVDLSSVIELESAGDRNKNIDEQTVRMIWALVEITQEKQE